MPTRISINQNYRRPLTWPKAFWWLLLACSLAACKAPPNATNTRSHGDKTDGHAHEVSLNFYEYQDRSFTLAKETKVSPAANPHHFAARPPSQNLQAFLTKFNIQTTTLDAHWRFVDHATGKTIAGGCYGYVWERRHDAIWLHKWFSQLDQVLLLQNSEPLEVVASGKLCVTARGQLATIDNRSSFNHLDGLNNWSKLLTDKWQPQPTSNSDIDAFRLNPTGKRKVKKIKKIKKIKRSKRTKNRSVPTQGSEKETPPSGSQENPDDPTASPSTSSSSRQDPEGSLTSSSASQSGSQKILQAYAASVAPNAISHEIICIEYLSETQIPNQEAPTLYWRFENESSFAYVLTGLPDAKDVEHEFSDYAGVQKYLEEHGVVVASSSDRLSDTAILLADASKDASVIPFLVGQAFDQNYLPMQNFQPNIETITGETYTLSLGKPNTPDGPRNGTFANAYHATVEISEEGKSTKFNIVIRIPRDMTNSKTKGTTLNHSLAAHRNLVAMNQYESFAKYLGVSQGMQLFRDEGTDLARYEGHFDDKLQEAVMTSVLKGLSSLADLNLIHRDIKPENIVVKQEAGKPVAHIIDTADVISIANERETTNDTQTTVQYAHPEISNGNTSSRTDVFMAGMLHLYLELKKNPKGPQLNAIIEKNVKGEDWAQLLLSHREFYAPQPPDDAGQSKFQRKLIEEKILDPTRSDHQLILTAINGSAEPPLSRKEYWARYQGLLRQKQP